MAQYTWIVALIPALPLAGFLINALLIRNGRTAGLVASAACLLALVASIGAIAVLQGLEAEPKRINLVLWDWVTIGAFAVPFGLLFDQLTAVMALLVTGVGALIHIYSIGYMAHDARPVRYFAYLNLFVAMMLILVMGNSLLLLFLGWEGVGLCSFLLIGHWFERRSVAPGINPSEAAVKAFVVNRVGDVGLLLGMMAIFAQTNSLTYYPTVVGNRALSGILETLVVAPVSTARLDLGIFGSIGILTAICLLLLFGAIGKSAQVPLFVWLPDAMAGPTPVSALIHAATMVTSGVYLLARLHPLFNASPDAAGWVVTIGVLTALVGATAAVAQFDIKRVLAYSTISQLGFMMTAVGMGAVTAAIFHLLTHGIFKALLFLGSGSIIHATNDTQDMRKMGGLRSQMPITFWTYLLGALSLSGIPLLAGFWSKDEIITHALSPVGNLLGGGLLVVASLFTAFYMGRQVALIFYGKARDTSYHAHESPWVMTVPLIILAVGAVIGGLINLPELHWLTTWLKPVVEEEAQSLSIGQWAFAIVLGLLATGVFYGGWYLYARVWQGRIKVGREDPFFRYLGDIWRGAELAWGFDWLYQRALVRPYRTAARFLSSVFDREAIDGLLVGGVASLFGGLSQVLRRAQSGYVRNYALVFLIGVLIVVGYFAFRS